MLRRIKKKMNHTELYKWIVKKLKEESTKKHLLEQRTFEDGTKNHSHDKVFINISDALKIDHDKSWPVRDH